MNPIIARATLDDQLSEPLRQFESTVVERLGESERFDDFLACKDAFDQLLTSLDVASIINAQLERSLNQGHYPTVQRLDAFGLIDRPNIKLFLGYNKPFDQTDVDKQRIVARTTAHHMIGCLSGGPINLALFKHEKQGPLDVFDRANVLVPQDGISLAPGQSAAFQAGIDTFTMAQCPGSLLLRLDTREYCHTRWDYDIHTGEPIRVVAAQLVESRVAFAVRMLGKLGAPESVPILTQLCDHPAHFVRWYAIEALGLIDRAKAIEALERAINDEHPHIRDAARRTLERVQIGEVA